MKFSALNVDFVSGSFDPLGSRSPPYERIKFGYPLQNARIMLLSTNIARERLQIDTDFLPIITSTADELYGGTNIDDIERHWAPKYGFLVNFSRFQALTHIKEWIFIEITEPRQPAHKIKHAVAHLMNNSSDFLFYNLLWIL